MPVVGVVERDVSEGDSFKWRWCRYYYCVVVEKVGEGGTEGENYVCAQVAQVN